MTTCVGAVTLRNFAWQAHYERTIVPTPDGGAFGLDWCRCREACDSLPESAPVLLVLHSITGQSPPALHREKHALEVGDISWTPGTLA